MHTTVIQKIKKSKSNLMQLRLYFPHLFLNFVRCRNRSTVMLKHSRESVSELQRSSGYLSEGDGQVDLDYFDL